VCRRPLIGSKRIAIGDEALYRTLLPTLVRLAMRWRVITEDAIAVCLAALVAAGVGARTVVRRAQQVGFGHGLSVRRASVADYGAEQVTPEP